MVFSTKH